MPAWLAHDYCRSRLSLVSDAETCSTQTRAHSCSKGWGWDGEKVLWSPSLPEHPSPEGCGFHVT